MHVRPIGMHGARRSDMVTRFRALAPYSGEALIGSWNITADEVTVSPSVVIVSRLATASDLPALVGADTAALFGSGSDPTTGSICPYGVGGGDDVAVRYNSGKAYLFTDNSLGDVTTEDFIIEIIANSGANTFAGIVDKGLTVNGWSILRTGSNTIQCYIDDGVTSKAMNLSISTDVWFHALFTAHRAGSMRGYLNSVAGTSTIISAVGSITVAAPISVGGFSSGANMFHSSVVSFALWKRSSWLSAASYSDLAKQRYAMWSGIMPALAHGSSLPTITRATTKHYSIGSRLYRASSGKVLVGDLGVEVNPAATNKCLQSNTWASGSWVKILSTVNSNVTTSPIGSVTAASVVSDTSNNSHRVYQTISLTGQHTFSCYYKQAARTYVCMNWYNVTDGHHYTFFDIANGTVGTTGGSTTARMSGPDAYGFYRCEITFTPTTGNTDCYFYPAEDDNDIVFVGDGATIDIYCYGAQVEEGPHATPYIETGAVSATRNADLLRYVGSNNLGIDGSARRGRLSVTAQVYSAMTSDAYIVSLNDGGASTDRIELLIKAATGYISASIESTEDGAATTATGTTDLRDESQHEIVLEWGDASMRVYVDGRLEASAQGMAIPDELDRIDIGSSYAAVGGSVHVANLRIAA